MTSLFRIVMNISYQDKPFASMDAPICDFFLLMLWEDFDAQIKKYKEVDGRTKWTKTKVLAVLSAINILLLVALANPFHLMLTILSAINILCFPLSSHYVATGNAFQLMLVILSAINILCSPLSSHYMEPLSMLSN